MPSMCPICQSHFPGWPEYHEHINLAHGVLPTKQQIVRNTPSVPVDVRKHEYKAMNPRTKESLVKRGERRLGAEHFFLGGK